MRYRLRTLLIVLALGNHFAAVADLRAFETGSLQMRFLYDGEPPPENRPKSDADRRNVDESLIINSDNRGIQNVAVWLLRTPGDLFAVDAADEPKRPERVMALRGGNFSPRLAILRTPQTLVIYNADPWGYPIMADCQQSNQPFNAVLKPGESMVRRFEFREELPVRLTSAIQPWVRGYVLVLDQPHAAVSDVDGRLVIKDIPVGNWGFVVWHERRGVVKKAVQDGQSIEWPRGVMSCKIKPGTNDLGEFMLPPEQLQIRP